MDIVKTKAALALALSSAMSVGTVSAGIDNNKSPVEAQIVSVSSPDVRVTVYDGIATVFGNASSSDEASAMENELLELPEISYVINMITWE